MDVTTKKGNEAVRDEDNDDGFSSCALSSPQFACSVIDASSSLENYVGVFRLCAPVLPLSQFRID